MAAISISQDYVKTANTYAYIPGKGFILKYTKKYRFESMLPFASTYKTQKLDVSFT